MTVNVTYLAIRLRTTRARGSNFEFEICILTPQSHTSTSWKRTYTLPRVMLHAVGAITGYGFNEDSHIVVPTLTYDTSSMSPHSVKWLSHSMLISVFHPF